MSYKKRARDGWNCGKDHKDRSNKEERTYAKEEISQAIDEYEAGDEYRYKHYAHTKNEQAKLEGMIKRYKADTQRWERGIDQTHPNNDSWFRCHIQWVKQQVVELSQKLEILIRKDIRRCNYCRKDTPTKEEDCTVCSFSKTNE